MNMNKYVKLKEHIVEYTVAPFDLKSKHSFVFGISISQSLLRLINGLQKLLVA